MTTGKTIALTIWTFVGRVMALFFNTLPRFVITFLSRSNCLLISELQVTVHSDFGAQEEEICHCCHLFPLYLPWSSRPNAMILVFIFSLKPVLSLPSFTLVKRLFISSSLSAIRVVSSAYLRLLMFLPPILIPASHPAQHFSWCALHID